MQEIWENIYASGKQLNRYPWDCVVSFLYRYSATAHVPINKMRILEIGCGSGSNLWFAAREGASVVGIDTSKSSIEYAEKRFTEDSLVGQFYCATLPNIPEFTPNYFDCIIDRACLTHCSDDTTSKSLATLSQLLRPQGLLLSTFYGRNHSSHLSGDLQENGQTTGITSGTLTGVGPITFYDHDKIQSTYSPFFDIIALDKLNKESVIPKNSELHEEWHLTASPRS
ncbi:MAG: class I SAM-dependent methyltransferase [Akkermansiaceae bacterium]